MSMEGIIEVACYLCAYTSKDVPQQVDPLPANSPANPRSPLATCWKCSVWACSLHGTLYSSFECARCTPGVAVTQVLTTGPTNPNGPTAAALANFAGGDATQRQIERMRTAVSRVIDDAKSADIGEPHVQFLAPTAKPNNVVADLASVVAKHTDYGRRGSPFFAAAEQRPGGPLSIEAVAASVRSTFARSPISEATDAVVTTVMGALLMAEAVAHDPIARARSSADRIWPSDREPLPPPWAVSHPGLLDPVMWLIGTAYEEAS